MGEVVCDPQGSVELPAGAGVAVVGLLAQAVQQFVDVVECGAAQLLVPGGQGRRQVEADGLVDGRVRAGVALAGVLLGFGGAVGVTGKIELGGRGEVEEIGDGGGDHIRAGRGGPVIQAEPAQRLRFRLDPGQGGILAEPVPPGGHGHGLGGGEAAGGVMSQRRPCLLVRGFHMGTSSQAGAGANENRGMG